MRASVGLLRGAGVGPDEQVHGMSAVVFYPVQGDSRCLGPSTCELNSLARGLAITLSNALFALPIWPKALGQLACGTGVQGFRNFFIRSRHCAGIGGVSVAPGPDLAMALDQLLFCPVDGHRIEVAAASPVISKAGGIIRHYVLKGSAGIFRTTGNRLETAASGKCRARHSNNESRGCVSDHQSVPSLNRGLKSI